MVLDLVHAGDVLAVAQGAIPNPPAVAPPGVGDKISTLLGWGKWGGLIAGIVGLIACGIMMAVGRRNRSSMAADGASGIPWVLAGLTVVSFSTSIVSATVA
ncbi:hypothetical protein MN205_06335 [Kineococcus sp. TRM81007]|uniref:hypothetical protein n=1 Tax=Kineococcus sp. TRM81007 TaxID=2925831 RepID=UPI001F59611F|nr:hypothetical protein [Kineococcus sp. TRM81007]MCI2238108.1 hypothetical protein [Kineococcus sp. TRM81007]